MNYVIGLDFGTDSVRAVLVDTGNGKTMSQAVEYYPRWKQGLYCDPHSSRFRQHPLDYIETLEAVIRQTLAACPQCKPGDVKGIAVDTTGSTPIFCDADGLPLALKNDFAEDPDAMFILWKDHTSVREAAEINKLAASWPGQNPVAYVGGIYSSEWYWAKALHVIRNNPEVRNAAASMIEHCDWIPALLTGTIGAGNIMRSRCAAGHKVLWNEEFGGYPEETFFKQLDPKLVEIRSSLGTETHTSDVSAGALSAQWAERLGLTRDCVVGVGAFDAHMGAVGAGIGPYQLAKVIGTSTCDVYLGPDESSNDVVVGICGQVKGSVIPGKTGYEAGQSAFGDAYAWLKKTLMWPLSLIEESAAAEHGVSDTSKLEAFLNDAILPGLEARCRDIKPGESGVLALDWLNGRRTPDADQLLRGGFAGLNLGTDAPRMYRALVEATAFGARAIVERFRSQGLEVRSLIALGGVSLKSEFVMQTLADIVNMQISVSAAEQAGALGAAMFAAAAAGVYPNVEAAQRAMSAGVHRIYEPNPVNATLYDEIYQQYQAFGEFEERYSEFRSRDRD
ncbi:ribulokinase [Spirochaeta dissipatitropha]